MYNAKSRELGNLNRIKISQSVCLPLLHLKFSVPKAMAKLLIRFSSSPALTHKTINQRRGGGYTINCVREKSKAVSHDLKDIYQTETLEGAEAVWLQ